MECEGKFISSQSTTIYNFKCCENTVWQRCSCLATPLCLQSEFNCNLNDALSTTTLLKQ